MQYHTAYRILFVVRGVNSLLPNVSGALAMPAFNSLISPNSFLNGYARSASLTTTIALDQTRCPLTPKEYAQPLSPRQRHVQVGFLVDSRNSLAASTLQHQGSRNESSGIGDGMHGCSREHMMPRADWSDKVELSQPPQRTLAPTLVVLLLISPRVLRYIVFPFH